MAALWRYRAAPIPPQPGCLRRPASPKLSRGIQTPHGDIRRACAGYTYVISTPDRLPLLLPAAYGAPIWNGFHLKRQAVRIGAVLSMCRVGVIACIVSSPGVAIMRRRAALSALYRIRYAAAAAPDVRHALAEYEAFSMRYVIAHRFRRGLNPPTGPSCPHQVEREPAPLFTNKTSRAARRILGISKKAGFAYNFFQSNRRRGLCK